MLIDGLRQWLSDKPPDVRLWPSFWRNRAAKMLRVDLKAAKIDVADDKGAVVDFHSLRVTFVTNLMRHFGRLCDNSENRSSVFRVAPRRYHKANNAARAIIAALPAMEVPV